MSFTYTSNLKLALPVTGTESGTWGDAVNNQITTLVDQSISGTVSLTSMTNADYTLTNGNGNAANEARYMALLVPSSLTLTAARNIIVPSTSKTYIVKNVTTGGFSVTVKTSAGTGIEVPNGSEMLLYCDGTNVVVAFDTINVNSVNGGQLAGLRNRVINGQGWINQRGPVAVQAGLAYGPDRMMASIASGTGISGNITSGSLAGTSTGYGWGLNACSWTTGAVQLAQRIESWNVLDMNSKTVTFSGKIFQDTGGSRTFNIIIQKATAGVNNFTTTSTIASTTVTVSTSTTTPFSFTTTLGASDATNGIQLIVVDTVVNTATSKTYFTSDWQFEIGSVATTFEQRPIGLELALCQRYFQPALLPRYAGYVGGGSQGVVTSVTFPPMRVAPTITATFSQTNTTGAAFSNISGSGATFGATVTATGSFDFQAVTGALSAEL